jgi:NAD(P)-dependent dehydrogenase (short-subunit alcohol dehydrogenase family)
MTAGGEGRFAGRTCFITGSTGMAASAARAIAAEGGAVYVVSRTAGHAEALAQAITADGGAAAWRAADVASETEVESAVAACVDRFGRIDAAYTTAGISGRHFGDGPLHEASLAGWETVMATNATSQFLACRAVIRRMLGQGPDAGGARGTLLTMSSTLAQHPSPRHFATHAYAASKGAIEAFTRAVAAFYAPHGIRVNAIAPALVATPMSERAQSDPQILAYLARKQPLAGGPIDAEAVTRAALFLLSDDARMVTGQVIVVDAGWSVREG